MSKTPITKPSCLTCMSRPICKVYDAWKVAVDATTGRMEPKVVPEPPEGTVWNDQRGALVCELFETVAGRCKLWGSQ